MPRFFLDMENGDDRYFDDIGCCASDECEVLSALIEVLTEYRRAPLYQDIVSQFRISIIDTSGRTVVRLTM